jgi:hypothetical protein
MRVYVQSVERALTTVNALDLDEIGEQTRASQEIYALDNF